MLKIRTKRVSLLDNTTDYKILEYKLHTHKSVCTKFLQNWRVIQDNTQEPMELLEEYPASVLSLEALTEQLRQGCQQILEEYPHLPLPNNWQNTVYTNEDLNILHDGFVEVCRADIERAQQEGQEVDARLLHLLETINIGVHKVESRMLYEKTDQTPPYIQSLMYPDFDQIAQMPLTRQEAEESYDVTYSLKNCLIIANQILGKSLEAISFDDDYKSLLDTEHASHFVPKTTIKTGMSMFIAKTYCECCGQSIPYHITDTEMNNTVNKQMLDWCEKNNVSALGIDPTDPYNKCGRMIIGEQSNTSIDDYKWFTDDNCTYSIERIRFDTEIITAEFYKSKDADWRIETNASRF